MDAYCSAAGSYHSDCRLDPLASGLQQVSSNQLQFKATGSGNHLLSHPGMKTAIIIVALCVCLASASMVAASGSDSACWDTCNSYHNSCNLECANRGGQQHCVSDCAGKSKQCARQCDKSAAKKALTKKMCYKKCERGDALCGKACQAGIDAHQGCWRRCHKTQQKCATSCRDAGKGKHCQDKCIARQDECNTLCSNTLSILKNCMGSCQSSNNSCTQHCDQL